MSSILVVMQVADSYQLTTKDAVKQLLGITNTASDATIESLIDQASSVIGGHCERVLVNEKVKETFRFEMDHAHRFSVPGFVPRSSAPKCFRLTRYPVTAIDSVTIDGTVLDASCYEVDPKSGLLYRLVNDCRAHWRFRKAEIVYNGGYFLAGDIPPLLPKAIVGVANTLVKSAFFAAARDPLVKSELVPGVAQVDYWVGVVPGSDGSALPPEITDPLSRYVKVDR